MTQLVGRFVELACPSSSLEETKIYGIWFSSLRIGRCEIMSMGLISAARTSSLHHVIDWTRGWTRKAHPLSPFLIPFTTSLTPRLTWRAFEAVTEYKSATHMPDHGQMKGPFLIVLCNFLTNFFCASGCARGDKSSRAMTTSSFSFSFLDFFGDCYTRNCWTTSGGRNSWVTHLLFVVLLHVDILANLLSLLFWFVFCHIDWFVERTGGQMKVGWRQMVWLDFQEILVTWCDKEKLAATTVRS